MESRSIETVAYTINLSYKEAESIARNQHNMVGNLSLESTLLDIFGVIDVDYDITYEGKIYILLKGKLDNPSIWVKITNLIDIFVESCAVFDDIEYDHNISK
jgi:hypothetical protein